MANKIKFGIIGFGKIGPRHKQKIDENGNCELIAVCDIDQSRLKSLEKQEIKLYNDYKIMLNNPNINVVSVCTPNYLHARMTVDSLNTEKHVLCEKPMALTSDDCEDMVEAARTNKRKLFVVMQNRYNPPVQAVRKLIDEDKLGEIYSVVLNCYWNRNKEYYDSSPWKGFREKDGGALYTQFSHFIDLVYWFAGKATSVHAIADNYNHSEIEIEDTGIVTVKFASGALGSINFTNCAYDKNMEGSITIFGENGTVKIGGEYLNTLEYQNVKDLDMIKISSGGAANDYGTYKGSMSNHHKVYENVADVLLHNGKIAVDGNEGMRSLKIIEAIYKSIETGETVLL